MVKQASESESKAWGALPSSTEMALRRISSVLLMAGLLSVITPFAPFSWIFDSEGAFLLDNFLSVPILIGAVVAQWTIAGAISPLVINVLDNVFIYRHKMYWNLAAIETGVVLAIRFGQHEMWRRFASVGLVGALWAIGWAATPARFKREAWEQLKWVWTWMAFHEARSLVRGGRRRW